jgi:hypothetical protein
MKYATKKKFTKAAARVIIAAAALLIVLALCACDAEASTSYGSEADNLNTQQAADRLQYNQPTPTDIEYSLERYNLIRRAYWVNGQREKANALPCAVEKPLGYVILLTESGSVVGRFTVDGKVSSLNSFLTPDSEYYELVYGGDYTKENAWLADVDGSYGENDNGIFFFTPDGKYVEWSGIYLYSDIPFEVSAPVVNYTEVG